jgi:hypothetical protein
MWLESLEDRTLPSASVLFDSFTGELAIRTDAGDNVVREVLTAGGFLDVTANGQEYSSDPTSAAFDKSLAGASDTTLAGIRFDGGGGQDTLILGSQTLPDSLTVSATGANITVDGAVHSSAITLAGSGWVTIAVGALLRADQIAVTADVFANSGQLNADGAAGGRIFVSARSVLNTGQITVAGTVGDGGRVQVAFSESYVDTAAALTSAGGGGAAGNGGVVTIDGGTTGRLFSSGSQVATGSAGGSIDLLGREVVLDDATVDASGHFGDGGRVTLWSEQDTEFSGSISARGGVDGGSGGFIEVSGADSVTFAGTADAGAPGGRAGTVLLDPKNLVIDASAGVFPQFNLIDPHPTLGSNFGDSVIVLGNGNVVVTNPHDNFGGTNAGAAYLFNGLTGALISSLVGSSANDTIGSTGVIDLSNGNYVIASRHWSGNLGAATWGSGTVGVSGTVSQTNSLVGSSTGDLVGEGLFALQNGNYVVTSPSWSGDRGAATWGSGTTGVTGIVSATNSLVGSNPAAGTTPGDEVGSDITDLQNGNYVVSSPSWNHGRGAATWGSGTTGVTGVVSETNSLVGSNPASGNRSGDEVGDFIAALQNGNYVVSSSSWNNDRGAATWGSGTAGVTGAVSATNSLVGSNPAVGTTPGDEVGSDITALQNGNYVVGSPSWNSDRGAATWGSGTTGIIDVVSATNSLIGSNPRAGTAPGDEVGAITTALQNGNYVVGSPSWNSDRGAATWGSGTTGIIDAVSATNSLVGSNPAVGTTPGDEVGASVTALQNGNYVVGSPRWNSDRGAATWGSGTTGIIDVVSATNSLVGSNPAVGTTPGDEVGASVTALQNGNYVVGSPSWNSDRGAATWGSGTTGIIDVVSATNSLVGSNPAVGTTPGDEVGANVTALQNGNYVVASPNWNGKSGATTWGSGTAGVTGIVSGTNSLVGANPNDQVGLLGLDEESGNIYGVFALSNGNYVVGSAFWNGNRGAATWCSGTSGQTLDGNSNINAQNSLVGLSANAGLVDIGDSAAFQSFVVNFVTEGSGRVTVGLVDPNQLTFARGQAQTVTITPGFLTRTLNTGTAVVLQASNDITVNSPVTVSAGGNGGALTLQAGRSILLNASITTDNGALTLIANDQLANGVVDSQRDPGSAVITMAAGTTLNTGSGALTVQLRDGAGLTNHDSGAITLQTVTAGSASVVNNGPSAGSNIILGTVTTSGAQSYTNPNGTATVTGNLTTTNSPVTFNQSVVLNAGLTINVGTSAVNFAGGTAAPNPGTLTVTGGFVLTSSTTFSARLNGTDPSNYSQVMASGPINLGGGTLSLVLGFQTPVGSTYTLLTTSSGPIQGTFAGLPEAAIFTQGGSTFQITYQGGPGGNSVVLTCLG